MAAGEVLRQIECLFAAQPHRDAQQSLGRCGGQHGRNCSALKIELVLIEPPLRATGVHDVERDREAISGKLGMDIQIGAVELDLALFQPRPFDKPQRWHRLTPPAIDRSKIILVIVAPIARPEIAQGQKVEIVIVRQSDREGRIAAGADHVLIGRGPDVGADEEIALRRDQHDHLRTISVVQSVSAVPPGQLLNQHIAQESLVVAQPPQPPRSVTKTFLFAGVKPAGTQGIADFIERRRAAVSYIDYSWHTAIPASCG